MFNENFVKLLQEKSISAYRLSQETGISQGLISDYKNGVKKPTTENLIKIADFFNCSIDNLLGRTGADENEIKLINQYRSVTEAGKNAIKEYVEFIANSDKYKKYTDVSEEA